MPRLTVIAIGGVLGSLARYGIAVAVGPWNAEHWPWQTLIVNVLGCLAIGMVASSRAVEHGPLWLRPFLITGILGGFTTFSAFALESGLLLEAGRVFAAALYIALTLVLCLVAVRVGVLLVRRAR